MRKMINALAVTTILVGGFALVPTSQAVAVPPACCYGDCMDHCDQGFWNCHQLCNEDCEAC